jgi:hypothetical protein
MNKTKVLVVLIASGLLALPALAGLTPLPSSFAGSTTDYISFNGSSFPGSNLICFSAGCGGGFQGTVYGPGKTMATGPSVLTTVWCVDYQLDVTTSSAYITNITTLDAINSNLGNVRYGNLNSVDPTGVPPGGWANSVIDPTGIDGGAPIADNSAAYRYTLAAALVSQYVTTPTNLNGSSPVNQAIQEAIWYITYNSDYETGATWPPPGQGIPSSEVCLAGQSATNPTGNTDYACWVKYAEANAGSVNTKAWAVISGPTASNGSLITPPPLVDGYPSYQTFLVQVNPTPEPAYFALTLGLGAFIFFVRQRRAKKQA